MRSTKQSTTTKTSTEKPETSQQSSRSNSVNQVTLVGRLVADPQLRETGNGKHVSTVRIATNNGASAEFHNVVLWGQLADFATTHLKKGRETAARTATAGSRTETVSAKDAPDRARRDANAKASKLALDADTAPAPVLSGEPDDELDELIEHGRPTRTTRGSPAPPFAPRELSVPTKERLWRDEEGAPAPSRQQTRGGARIARSTGR